MATGCGEDAVDPPAEIDEATILIDLSDEDATTLCEGLVDQAASSQEGHTEARLVCLASSVFEESAEACETALEECLIDPPDGRRVYDFVELTCDADAVSRINDCAEATVADFNRCWMSRFDARTTLYDLIDSRGCELAGDEEARMDLEALTASANRENDSTPECEGIRPC